MLEHHLSKKPTHYINIKMSGACEFSLQVKVDGETVFQDAMSGVNCKQTIGEFKRDLESKYNGNVLDLYYADGGNNNKVLEKDIPDFQTLEGLHAEYEDQVEEYAGTLFVKMTKKTSVVDIRKQIQQLQKQSAAIDEQIKSLEKQLKAVGGTKKRKTRKQRRAF